MLNASFDLPEIPEKIIFPKKLSKTPYIIHNITEVDSKFE